MNWPIGDSQVEDKVKRIHPIAWGLYDFCRSSRDRYRALGMDLAAETFSAYLKKIEVEFTSNDNNSDESHN